MDMNFIYEFFYMCILLNNKTFVGWITASTLVNQNIPSKYNRQRKYNIPSKENVVLKQIKHRESNYPYQAKQHTEANKTLRSSGDTNITTLGILGRCVSVNPHDHNHFLVLAVAELSRTHQLLSNNASSLGRCVHDPGPFLVLTAVEMSRTHLLLSNNGSSLGRCVLMVPQCVSIGIV